MFRSYPAAPDEAEKDLRCPLRSNVDAVFCARGYGSLRLLDPSRHLFQNLLGYSDITTLHLVLNRKWLPPIMVVNFAKDPLQKKICGNAHSAKLCPLLILMSCRRSAPSIRCCEILRGGNLSLVAAS